MLTVTLVVLCLHFVSLYVCKVMPVVSARDFSGVCLNGMAAMLHGNRFLFPMGKMFFLRESSFNMTRGVQILRGGSENF